MRLWILISLLAVSAWRHDSLFSSNFIRRTHPNAITGRRSSISMFCSAEENIFVGFGGKHLSEQRNTASDERVDDHSSILEADSILALPEPRVRDSTDPTHRLQVNGDSVSMDELGPIIVNTDGTLSRIENWAAMTKGEQATTFKLISRRNRKRLDALKELEHEEDAHRTDSSGTEKEKEL